MKRKVMETLAKTRKAYNIVWMKIGHILTQGYEFDGSEYNELINEKNLLWTDNEILDKILNVYDKQLQSLTEEEKEEVSRKKEEAMNYENAKENMNPYVKMEVALEILSSKVGHTFHEGYTIDDFEMQLLMAERNLFYSGDKAIMDKIMNVYAPFIKEAYTKDDEEKKYVNIKN